MKSTNNIAKISGALFLIAMLSSISGGLIIGDDLSISVYKADIDASKFRLILGIILELINAIAVVGIASALLPILKKYSETLALGYFGLRIIEAMFCILIVFAPLALISNEQTLVSGSGQISLADYLPSFIFLREQIFTTMIPLFFGLPALILYFIFLKTKLVPVFISIWGLVAVILMLAFNFLNIDQNWGMLLVLPMILNEIFLGFWLIFKGFNTNYLYKENI